MAPSTPDPIDDGPKSERRDANREGEKMVVAREVSRLLALRTAVQAHAGKDHSVSASQACGAIGGR